MELRSLDGSPEGLRGQLCLSSHLPPKSATTPSSFPQASLSSPCPPSSSASFQSPGLTASPSIPRTALPALTSSAPPALDKTASFPASRAPSLSPGVPVLLPAADPWPPASSCAIPCSATPVSVSPSRPGPLFGELLFGALSSRTRGTRQGMNNSFSSLTRRRGR